MVQFKFNIKCNDNSYQHYTMPFIASVITQYFNWAIIFNSSKNSINCHNSEKLEFTSTITLNEEESKLIKEKNEIFLLMPLIDGGINYKRNL